MKVSNELINNRSFSYPLDHTLPKGGRLIEELGLFVHLEEEKNNITLQNTVPHTANVA